MLWNHYRVVFLHVEARLKCMTKETESALFFFAMAAMLLLFWLYVDSLEE
jgi:hypothetical protein